MRFKHRTFQWMVASAGPLALAMSWVTAPGIASADAGSCVSLHASGQRGIKAGSLRQALNDFRACGSDESCPSAVRNECMELYASTERTLPTVIFTVVDEHGGDVAAVKVFSGTELLAEALDGRALPMDPGKHQLRFELPWGETETQEILIREGEKNRAINLKVRDPRQPATVGSVPPPAGPADTTTYLEKKPKRLPMGFWLTTGIGVAAVGTGAVFELLGRAKHEDLADCSPRCPSARRDDYDTAQRNYLIGDIALGAGVAAFGAATIIYFTSRGDSDTASAAATRPLPRIAIVPTTSGRGATLHVAGLSF
jgi:hypothetical protein